MRTPSIIAGLLVLLPFGHARLIADTVVLKGGKQIADVVVSRNDDQEVVINPWNSRLPEMTFEIPDKNRIPRDKVEQVIVEDAPLIEYRRRASQPGLAPDERVALARFAGEHKLKDEREAQLILALATDPQHPAALAEFGAAKWQSLLLRNPGLAPEVAELERAHLALRDAAEVARSLAELARRGAQHDALYLERARRSAAIAKGRRDKVPLTVNSRQAPGATYCILVPRNYDPLRPTALVVALHGGGAGGKDETLVTGSGEAAMPFYTDVAESHGVIVVCPTALKAPWSHPANEPVIDGVLTEMRLLFNIDPRRIYLTGHSMGGFGTWYWAPERKEVFAACSPCAGGGGTRAAQVFTSGELPVYIYHGADDEIVKPANDRDMARLLLGDAKKKGKGRPDAVYTELDGVGHGFPDAVRRDIFRWFAGRWKDDRKLKASSFDDKVGKVEIDAFGDPSAPSDDATTDASVKQLLDRLMRGGGAGAEAVIELGTHQDKATVKAVADVLRSRKANADVRTLAAQALGAIGLAEGIDPLARALDDEDYRVVDAAVDALHRIGGEDARAPLARATERLGGRFRESFADNGISHTEYEVRLQSFRGLLAAIATVGDADRFLPLVTSHVVEPVFLPGKMYTVWGDEDPRFKHASPAARQKLARSLSDCLIALGDKRAASLLARVNDAWSHDGAIAREIARGLEALR